MSAQNYKKPYKKTYKKVVNSKGGKPEYYKKKANKGEYVPYQPKGWLRGGGSLAGGALGTVIGGPAGGALGSFLGGKLGHLVSQVTGFGDYSIDQNSIMAGGMSIPQVVNSVDRGSVIIRHREFIRDISASTAFTILKFPLNPGQKSTFPWLSQIAANFEQYRLRGVLFEFLSTSSDAVLSSSTSTALGTVNIATDYDAIDAAYTDKRSMLNTMFSSSNKPSQTFIHPIECKKSINPLSLQYIRTELSAPANTDIRMYDLGNTYVATEGMQAATGNVGELWVTYEVELFKQQTNLLAYTDHFGLTVMDAGSWLGTAASSLDVGGSLGGTVTSGDTYSFPEDLSSGKFLCTYFCTGTTAVLGEIDLIITNGALVDYWSAGATLYLQTPAAGINSSSIMCQFVVVISAPNCVITFNGSEQIPTGTNLGDFWVTQISNTIIG